jgi:hypothetical protein
MRWNKFDLSKRRAYAAAPDTAWATLSGSRVFQKRPAVTALTGNGVT